MCVVWLASLRKQRCTIETEIQPDTNNIKDDKYIFNLNNVASHLSLVSDKVFYPFLKNMRKGQEYNVLHQRNANRKASEFMAASVPCVHLLLFEIQAPQEAVAKEGMCHSLITYKMSSYKQDRYTLLDLKKQR